MFEPESGGKVSSADSHFRLSNPSTDDLPSQSNVVPPVQYLDSQHSKAQRQPLRLLMFAILMDAVKCFQKNFRAQRGIKQREFEEAESWLFQMDPDGPFTFETVCGTLDIEPECFRRALVEWRNRKLAGEAVPTVGRHSRVVVAKRVTARTVQSERTSHARTES